tara:strand:- start:78 stop:401 length:324 start_codon:yes stop_codon:yes gene_type:complete
MADQNEQPLSALFMAVTDWLNAMGLSGKGHTLFKTDGPDGIHITLNCTKETHEGLPGFHMKLERGGMPIALLNPYEGCVIMASEDELIRTFKEAMPEGVEKNGRPEA